MDGVAYQENPSLTAQYAQRDGWRGWYRGFAANNRAYDSTAFANDYSLYTGGFALGLMSVSVSRSSSVPMPTTAMSRLCRTGPLVVAPGVPMVGVVV